MKINEENYEPLSCFAIPCYSYTEGNKYEEYWIDWQNCVYYYIEDADEEKRGYNKEGKKQWIISPVKPVGVKITEENEDLIKWVVYSGPDEDYYKEWDFEKHCPL